MVAVLIKCLSVMEVLRAGLHKAGCWLGSKT